jgi:hypothetical protein
MSDKNDNAAMAQLLGKELLGSAFTGLAGGAGAAGLYHLLSGLRNADPASLLPDTNVVGLTGSSRLPAKKRKTPPSRAKNSPINMYKSANSFLEQLQQRFGAALPTDYLPGLGRLLSGQPRPESASGAQEMWRNLANLGLAGAGGYVGLKAVNNVADTQRHDDSKADVETARKEYFDALTGKSAKHLDVAFEQLQKQAEEPGLLASLLSSLDRSAPGKAFGSYVATPAALTALGTGLVGGTYMYNQVKDRTKSENLRRAAAARARLAGLQKTPYVDPVELAALTQK